MRVLSLSESYPPDISGGATFAYEVSDRLVKNFGLELTMITRKYPSKLKIKDNFPVERIDIPTYRTEGGMMSMSRLKFIQKTISLVGKMQSDFNVLNFHFGAGTNTAMWLMKKLGMIKIPMVMSFLGTTAGHWQETMPFPLYNIYNFIETELIVGIPCDKYFVLDDGTRGYDLFVKAGIPRKKLIKIYQSVDCKVFRPMKVNRKKLTIGYFGRLDPFKGLDTFIESMILLNKRINDFQILIRADGPLKDWIVKRGKEGGIHEKIRFIPALPKNELPKFINSCDLLFLGDVRGYKNPEALSMTMAEAMACGSLFISSSKPRKEWKCQTWIRLDEPDPAKLSEIITDAICNTRYNKLRENARRIAVKFFDWDNVTKTVYKGLQEVA